MVLMQTEVPGRAGPLTGWICQFKHDESSTVATFDNPTTETRLRRFARDVIEKAMEGYNFDGADVQEIAVKHGLLKEVTVTESCGETCTCAEVVDFPTTCYRFTDAMEPAQYA